MTIQTLPMAQTPINCPAVHSCLEELSTAVVLRGCTELTTQVPPCTQSQGEFSNCWVERGTQKIYSTCFVLPQSWKCHTVRACFCCGLCFSLYKTLLVAFQESILRHRNSSSGMIPVFLPSIGCRLSVQCVFVCPLVSKIVFWF